MLPDGREEGKLGRLGDWGNNRSLYVVVDIIDL